MQKEIASGILLKKISDELVKQTNNTIKACDLTISQLGVLIILMGREDKQISLKQLERELNVAQSTAAGLVSRLEQKGFLEAFGQTDDKRIKNIRMTEAGIQYCEDAAKEMETVESDLYKSLTAEEQKQFHQFLKRIYESM